MQPRWHRPRRGQATGIIIFLLTLAVAALLFGLLNAGASELFSITSSQASAQQASDVIAQREKIWNNILFFPVVLAGIFLLARSILQSRQGGP